MDEKANSFMSFLNDPSQVIKSTKFSIATASIQFSALIIFAIIGASITFRFESFRDLLDLDYWITVVIMLVEQLYAYNIGYELGKSMMTNANEELRTTNEQINTLIEGKFDGDKELVAPLKRDSAYIDKACEILSNEDKVNLVTKRMKEIIKIFEAEYDLQNTIQKRLVARFLIFPYIIKIGNKKKRFWRRETFLTYCKTQIDNGNEMLDNKDAILAVPDKNIANYQKLEYANLLSSQNEIVNENVSRYHQRSEKVEKAKMAGRKALIKLGTASIGGMFVFGAIAGDQTLGKIIWMIVIMLIQLGNGFKFGSDNVIKIKLYNAMNRLKALQDIRQLLPQLKQEG